MSTATHPARTSPQIQVSLDTALLVCGILSSVLYGTMLVAIRYEGYSAISQTPSELTAIGAPTRALWSVLGPLYDLLVAAFAVGVWRAAAGQRPLRIVAGLLLALASLVFAWPFGAMHQREVLAAGGGTLSDIVHVAIGMVTMALILASIGFGAGAFGRRFRVYSIASLVAVVVFGILTGLESPRLAAGQPTPWIGLWERISIAAFLLWVIVLAVGLLRAEGGGTARWGRQ